MNIKSVSAESGLPNNANVLIRATVFGALRPFVVQYQMSQNPETAGWGTTWQGPQPGTTVYANSDKIWTSGFYKGLGAVAAAVAVTPGFHYRFRLVRVDRVTSDGGKTWQLLRVGIPSGPSKPIAL
jgi:hypothetical protein